MSLEIDFTDDEIREELARLGYENVPSDKLAEFKKDLMKLIHTERSRNTSMNSSGDEQRDYGPPTVVPEGKEASEFSRGNFTNHGSQWLGSGGFHEDWHYKGKTAAGQGSRPKSTPSDIRVPGSYGLYEMSSPSANYGIEDYDENNCREDYSDGGMRAENHMKRKIMRKTAQGFCRVDETLSESDTSGIFEIYEKIKNLAMRDCECGKSQPKSGDFEPPYRIKGENRRPSVITKKEHPHTRNLVRCKPGDRMKMYEKIWKKHPAIGDDQRENLRKMMHLKLLKKDGIHLDKKVYVPNTYIVPTAKQRLGLRWQVRSAMENYEMPPHGVYHDI